MMSHKTKYFQIMIVVVTVLFLFSGCSNNDSDNNNTESTLTNIWPHEDGNLWTYDLSESYISGHELDFYDNIEDVPEFVFDDLYVRLLEPADVDSTSQGTYQLEFDGMVTTDSGVTAQYLVETVSDDQYQSSGIALRKSDADVNLLLNIMRARPDLSDKITIVLREKGLSESKIMSLHTFSLSPPLFLGGYAWEQNDDSIHSYGDGDIDISWIYLEEDFSAGHSFVIQLVPGLANDIFLHGKITSVHPVEVDGVTYVNSVDCFYAIDFGVQVVTDEGGDPIGYIRTEHYGIITYVPEIGPVSCREQACFAFDDILQDPFPSMVETEASLTEFISSQ